MRILSLSVLLFAVACQSAQQSDTSAGVGSTSYSRGTPDTVASDTTRAVDTTTAGGEVTLTLDRESYAPGAVVRMTIRSRSEDTLGYNPCSSRTVERREGTAWVPHPEPDRMCTMELRLLAPNETQTANTDVPSTATTGTYRITLLLSRQRAQRPGEQRPGSVRAVSASFRVT